MALTITKQRRKDILIGAVIMVMVSIFSFLLGSSVYGSEGSAPSNGQISRINTLYTSLGNLGYGSDTNTPDRGIYWNKIFTAATWTPEATVTESDVLAGKTFYSDNRTAKTGTRYRVGYCPTQAAVDNGTTLYPNQHTNCTESITWVSADDNIEGSDKMDPITGMVWSYPLYLSGSTPVFDQYSSASNWSYNANGANNIAVGNKTAAQLCSERGNGWLLPSQKEMMQAYIDGAFWNLSQSSLQYWLYTRLPAGYYLSFNLGTGENGRASSGAATLVPVRCIRDGNN